MKVERWAIWQLATYDAAYGHRAGRYIIVTEDGEEEITGIVRDLETAQEIVKSHNDKITTEVHSND